MLTDPFFGRLRTGPVDGGGKKSLEELETPPPRDCQPRESIASANLECPLPVNASAILVELSIIK